MCNNSEIDTLVSHTEIAFDVELLFLQQNALLLAAMGENAWIRTGIPAIVPKAGPGPYAPEVSTQRPFVILDH